VSVLIARYGDRFGRRRCYRLLFVGMALAGTVFALTGWLPALILAGLTGTVSTDVVESGPFTSLEQAMLPPAAGPHDPPPRLRTLHAGRAPRGLARGAVRDRRLLAARAPRLPPGRRARVARHRRPVGVGRARPGARAGAAAAAAPLARDRHAPLGPVRAR